MDYITFTELRRMRRKTHKSLSGIETKELKIEFEEGTSRKTHKSLSGIETTNRIQGATLSATFAGKPINPYQGLKRFTASITNVSATAGKPINPYQGLKLFLFKLSY